MSLVETRQLPFDPSIDEYSAGHHLDAPYKISDKLYYDFQLTKSCNAYDDIDTSMDLCLKFRIGDGMYLGLAAAGGITEYGSAALFTTDSNYNTIATLEVEVYWCYIKVKQFKITDGKEVYVYQLVPTTTKSIPLNTFRSVDAGQDMPLTAFIAGAVQPDSVLVYTDRVSFWNDKNPYLRMQYTGGYTWQATVPATDLAQGVYRYNLVVFAGGRKQTFPSGTPRGPLDWDYTDYTYYQTAVQAPDDPLLLLDAASFTSAAETFVLPEWSQVEVQPAPRILTAKPATRLTYVPKAEGETFFLRRYVKDDLRGRAARLNQCRTLCLHLGAMPQTLQAGVVTTAGYTYLADCPAPDADGVVRIPLQALKQTDTALLPLAYPSFLDPYFHPETSLPLRAADIETLELRISRQHPGTENRLELGEVWLE